MKTMSVNLPQTIRLNAIDQGYILPETDDDSGPHLPMSAAAALTLRSAPSHTWVVRALGEMEHRFPQLRLGYRLDTSKNIWRCVPAAELDTYFASLVTVHPEPIDLSEALTHAIRRNPPLPAPIAITLYGNQLIVQMHHSFGDGRFLLQLIFFLILAIFDSAQFEQLPDLPMRFRAPLWRVVWQNLGQAKEVFAGWLRLLPDYVKTPTADPDKTPMEPIHSGSEMGVALKILPAEVIAGIEAVRLELSRTDKISFNTFLQVLVAHRLAELGLMTLPATYTIPVDLHRYLKPRGQYLPGNLASTLTVKTSTRPEPDLLADCIELQKQVIVQLHQRMPLANLPNEWLLRLGGNRTYKRMTQQWMATAINADPRFFVLSNVGNFDDEYKLIASYIEWSCGAFGAVSLMGAPHLILSFGMAAGQGSLSLVYDPRVLTEAHIEAIVEMFSPEWLAEKRSQLSPQPSLQAV
ncbi:MAG: hypothetical protein ABI947_24825 [Chloroflexota bacterium]